MGSGGWGLGFGGWGLGFEFGLRASGWDFGFGSQASGSGFRSGFQVWIAWLGFGVHVFGFRVHVFRFRVHAFGFMDSNPRVALPVGGLPVLRASCFFLLVPGAREPDVSLRFLRPPWRVGVVAFIRENLFFFHLMEIKISTQIL